MEWKNIYRGMVMGVSDIIPGVSGGTIAVILGIYDRLIAAINGLFSRDWKKHLGFLIPLAIGVGASLYLFSHVIKWLLLYYERPTFYFFLGLIIGVLPFLFRESHMRTTFRAKHYMILIVAIILITRIPTNVSEGAIIDERTFGIYSLLFVAGIAASAAMILPGISGSFVFMIIGVYQTVIHAVSTPDIKVLAVVAAGIGIGIILMSKIIHYFLTNFNTATFACIIGFVIGSTYLIFPGWATSGGELILCIVVFAGGLSAAYLLGKVEY